MDDEDDVTGVKPLTIWQQSCSRSSWFGVRKSIYKNIKEIQGNISALQPQVDVIKEEL